MPKRIAYCSDGTWQNQLSNTNVYRLYKALLNTSDQVTLYDDGVGADGTGFEKIIEGAMGIGLTTKITDAYTKIAHLYEDGDQLYLFGFSRGAYTARSLAGFIANCGLPAGNFTDAAVTRAFAAYRDSDNRATLLAALAGSADAPSGMVKPIITMVGAWDTVGALGVPALYGGIDQKLYGFLDTSLHPDVQNALHLIGIDEVRAQFPATLWTGAPATGQTLQQVWFAGCHSDIGGGTPSVGGVDLTTKLSDITLGYMATKAAALGLTFDPAVFSQFAQLPANFALDAIHSSWSIKDGPAKLRLIDPASNIASSVPIRIQYALTYQPGNLKITDNQLADTYTIIETIDPTAT